MALVLCPECKAQISDKAISCPQCGAPRRAPVAPAPRTSPTTIGCAGIIALGVLISLGTKCSADLKANKAAEVELERRAALSPEDRAAEDKRNAEIAAANAKAEAERTERTGAVYACRQFIEKQLKDPDSIEWVHLADQTYFEKKKNGRLFAQVQARANNSFGAKILTTFDCTVTHTGDNWRLQALKEH